MIRLRCVAFVLQRPHGSMRRLCKMNDYCAMDAWWDHNSRGRAGWLLQVRCCMHSAAVSDRPCSSRKWKKNYASMRPEIVAIAPHGKCSTKNALSRSRTLTYLFQRVNSLFRSVISWTVSFPPLVCLTNRCLQHKSNSFSLRFTNWCIRPVQKCSSSNEVKNYFKSPSFLFILEVYKQESLRFINDKRRIQEKIYWFSSKVIMPLTTNTPFLL